MSHSDETNDAAPGFDFDAYPQDTFFHERRTGRERRFKNANTPKPAPVPGAPERRAVKKERRRRIDPTTFEKQYTDDEIEFMNAMQRFKDQSGKAFPTYGEVLNVAFSLGYRKLVAIDDDDESFYEDEVFPINDLDSSEDEPTVEM